MHLQVKMLNLDFFYSYPTLQAELSPKFLSSPSDLIQIQITAIKREQPEVVYTYKATTKQIFIYKVIFFMKCG